jgi:hypothetical protein
MKAFCCILAAAGLLIAAPAMAQQVNGSGGGTTNIWSSAQGTSNSYGNANGFGASSSGSMVTAAGRGSLGAGGAGGGGRHIGDHDLVCRGQFIRQRLRTSSNLRLRRRHLCGLRRPRSLTGSKWIGRGVHFSATSIQLRK